MRVPAECCVDPLTPPALPVTWVPGLGCAVQFARSVSQVLDSSVRLDAEPIIHGLLDKCPQTTLCGHPNPGIRAAQNQSLAGGVEVRFLGRMCWGGLSATLTLPDYGRVARNPSRTDPQRKDHFFQADFPLLVVVSERKITAEWPTICPESWSSFLRTTSGYFPSCRHNRPQSTSTGGAVPSGLLQLISHVET